MNGVICLSLIGIIALALLFASMIRNDIRNRRSHRRRPRR